MIGGFEDVVDVNSLVPSVGTIQYPIYQFNPGAGYGTAANLTPGYGYWVKVSQNCTITIPDVLAKSRKGEVAEQLFKEDWGKDNCDRCRRKQLHIVWSKWRSKSG